MNNLTWIKGDITGDIYYDLFKLESQGHPVSALIFNGQGGIWGGRREWAAGMRVRAVGRTGLRSCAQRQPPGRDRPPPAA